ncbi:MAG: hypothetical protein Q4G07_09110 [Oscillospiraceae bacterium]|nr:hypothetical protein [Oscillospiraceae bacterium]
MSANRRNKSQKVALCGMVGALACACMVLGGFIPLATFVTPAIAGMLVLVAAIELGYRTGYLLYGVIGLLSLFLSPDKELSCIFLFFLGYYPLLKSQLDSIKHTVLRWLVKLGLFNVSIVAMYALLIFIFPLPELVADFSETGVPLLAGLGLAANLTFCIYDLAITKIVWIYLHKYRPRILKGKQ